MKRTTLRKNWVNVLVVAVAAALAVVVWARRDAVTTAEREARKRNVLPAFRRDEVLRVELHGEAGDVVLERADGGEAWFLRGAIAERADSHAVDGLLGALEFATRVREAPADAPGLAAPRVRAKVVMGRLTYELALGGPAPTPQGAAYLRVEGEGAFVVTAELAKALLDGAATFRSRTVMPYLSLDLATLEIRDGAGKGFVIERTDDVAFRLPDLGVRASRDALDGVWQALVELRASAFLTDAEADAAARPELTIRMTPRDAARGAAEIALGGACPGHPEDVVFVRRSPSRANACVPGGLLARLRVSPADLADRRLFVTRLDEVESIRIAALPPGLAVELARKGGGWQLRAPESRELAADEADMATSLVGNIVHGEGAAFAPPAPGAPFSPKARVTVTRAEPRAEETVELDGVVVRRAQDGAAGSVQPELARRLAPSLVALRGRSVWSPPVAGADYTALALECDGVAQRLTRGKSWSYAAPAGLPADDAAAIDVADAIARLGAEAWIAEKDDGTFGLADARCSGALTVATDAGARAVRVVLGRATEGGVYARADGQEPVFVAPLALRDALTRVLVSRDALSLEGAGALELRRGGRVVVLSLDAGAAPSLRAEAVVHLGPARPDEGMAEPSLEVRAAGGKEARVRLGRATLRRDQKVYFARIDGVDATFAVAAERVAPLLDRFPEPK